MEAMNPEERRWDLPPTPPLLGSVDLRVSKRLLWVAGAVYPLQNVARVYTLTVRPRRRDATVSFCKNVVLTLAVAVAFTMLGAVTALGSVNLAGWMVLLVWLVTLAALIYFLVELITVLSAQPHYVLAVETSGASTAVVTSADPQQLNWLVGRIAYAIENPETEFQVRVDSITISPKNYYFGDNVNMYGGTNNVGMASA